MENITMQDFLVWQPGFPKRVESDTFYLDLANRLLKESKSTVFGDVLPFAVLKRMCLCLTGYIQDIVSDAGIWRSFVDANRRMYGFSVPFHKHGEEYVDYELNREDVRFLTWYSLAMGYESLRDIYPHKPEILELADKWFEVLERAYDDAPEPEGYNVARELDFYDPADSAAVFQFGQWLFLHCYLMTPAMAMSLGEIMSDPELMKEENVHLLHSRLEEAMMELPTGPLAYFVPEWVSLILNGKMLKKKEPANDTFHPYYEKFIKANGGKNIVFFATYQEMNNFFIEAMGWAKGEEHLAMMKNDRDFCLMVNKNKGMLAAKNVAGCIAAPGNPCYNKDYAKSHAFRLLTERGLCPGDLLREVLKEGWLPDAHFPDSDDLELVAENADFIGRCYLQLYNIGD